MKNTPFTNLHKANGAKMVSFAGYNMPIEFSGINNEHVAVRTNVGIFDVSHMGEIWVKGANAMNLVQKLTTNDVSKLKVGRAQYTCMPNGKGGIVDDMLVYHYEDLKYLLIPNASNIEKVWNWMNENNDVGAELENASEKIAQLAIQGPKAVQLLNPLTEENLEELKYFSFITTKFAGCDNVIISATGYTGAGGVEIYMYKDDALKIWDAIMKAGEKYDLLPIGLAARDTLRLEMGFCLYGNDIDDTTSPIEANLGWITKMKDHNDFIDKALLAKQKAEGPQRLLKGFEMIERAIPRKGYNIEDADGNVIGKVTSGTMSPSLKKGIGMGYVKTVFAKDGQEIYIRIRNKAVKAAVTSPPFYKG